MHDEGDSPNSKKFLETSEPQDYEFLNAVYPPPTEVRTYVIIACLYVHLYILPMYVHMYLFHTSCTYYVYVIQLDLLSKYLEGYTKSVLLIRGTYYQYWLT